MKKLLCAFLFLNASTVICLAQEPYKLGVQENVPGSGSASYPAPQMIGAPATPAVKKAKRTLSGNTKKNNLQNNNAQSGSVQNSSVQSNNVQSPMGPEIFSSSVTAVALPPIFLGAWQVHGQRTTVEALPEFQAGAAQAFTVNNDQIWNISGNQESGYTLGSNTGISTALIVDKVQGNTAFVRYQHPVGNTMAQEAIVMSLRPGGREFDGLERISIVKQGLPQPRAKVTYQLMGVRQ